jgi:hypothetical protein
MKATRIIRNTTLALGLTAALTGITFAADKKDKDDHDTVVPWSQVPPAVQAAITAEAKGGNRDRRNRKGGQRHVKVKLPNGDELETDAGQGAGSSGKTTTTKSLSGYAKPTATSIEDPQGTKPCCANVLKISQPFADFHIQN